MAKKIMKMSLRGIRKMKGIAISIHIDGGVAGTQFAGAAAIARTEEGFFVGWLSRQLPAMTNNEAEYHALLLGLTLARNLDVEQFEIVSDSEVVVKQMRGQSQVHSQRLKGLHQEACRFAAVFASVSFRHVPRDLNSLADALATEALSGQVVTMPSLKTSWRQRLQRGSG